MARVLHGNVRASDDGRKYFLSGNQELTMKVLGHQNKIVTNGTDVVELLLICIDRCRGNLKELDGHLAKAVQLHDALPATVRAENDTNRSEGELGAQVPVGERKIGGPVTGSRESSTAPEPVNTDSTPDPSPEADDTPPADPFGEEPEDEDEDSAADKPD